MTTRSTSAIVVALLVVGLTIAAAIGWGLKLISQSIHNQRFTSSGYKPLQVVELADNKFAVIEGSAISVYRVDDRGQVERLSDIWTGRRKLEPNLRPKKYGFDYE